MNTQIFIDLNSKSTKANKTSGIYAIFCTSNGKVYIGQSLNIYRRWTEHRGLLKRKLHKNFKLQSSWNKYGSSAFEFHILEYCVQKPLTTRESYYLSFIELDFQFNLEEPLDRKIHSVETKTKISLKNKGRIVSPETRLKISYSMTGRKQDETHVKLRTEKLKGRISSEESRQKMSQSSKGKAKSAEHRRHMSEAAKNRRRYK